ncbi:MAG: hypothetical protein ABEN55_15310 [Bradymonadaceae bacterium]
MVTRQAALADISIWKAQERAQQIKSISRASLVKSILGGVGTSAKAQGRAAARAGQETILQNLQASVASLIASKTGIKGLLAQSMGNQVQKLEAVQTQVEELDDHVQELDHTLENMPDPPDDYDSVQTLVDEVSSLNETGDEEAIASDLRALANEGVLSEDEIESFIRQQRLEAQPDQTSEQTVQELSDNYYRVTTRQESEPLDPDQGLEFDPPLENVAGYDDVVLHPERGTIELVVDSSEEVPFQAGETIEVRPYAPPKGKRASRDDTQAARIRDVTKQVKEDLGYHFAACTALHLVAEIRDIVSAIDGVLNDIKNQIRGLIDNVLSGLKIDTGVLAKNLTLEAASSLLEGTGAGELFGEISDLTEQAQDFGETDILDIEGAGGGIDQACAAKHRAACDIKRGFKDLEQRVNQLLKEGLEDLEGSLSIDLPDLIERIESALLKPIGELNPLQKLARELRAEVCSWIDRKLEGSPQHLEDMSQRISAMLQAVQSALQVYQSIASTLATVKEIQDVVQQLKQLKLSGPLRKLFSGDIDGFFKSLANDLLASKAGDVAEKLRALAEQETNRHAAQSYHELANTVEARARQNRIGQRVRQGMRARRFQNSNVQTANRVQKQMRIIHETKKSAQARRRQRQGPSGAPAEEEPSTPPGRTS